MTQPLRSSPRAERTRASILAAAERLFAEHGFAATRLEDVAERVGIRRASIVYYFRDKRELYEAVLGDVVEGLYQRTEAALAAPGDLRMRVEAAVSAFVDCVGARPALARLLLREVADGTPERPPALLRHAEPFLRLIEKLRAQHSDDPLMQLETDPVQMASAIVGTTVFFVAAMPGLIPGRSFDPLAPGQLASLKREVLRAARLLRPEDPA